MAGYDFDHNQTYTGIGANAGPLSLTYGTGGWNASLGFGWQHGFGVEVAGLNYNRREGLWFNSPFGSSHLLWGGTPYMHQWPELNLGTVSMPKVSFPRISTYKWPPSDYVYDGGWLPDFTVTGNRPKTYYEMAQTFAGARYQFGGMADNALDCSGLICRAAGYTDRVWWTGQQGTPPGNWWDVTSQYPTNSIADFINYAKKGDLFVWQQKGHAAFSNGGKSLFHASSGSGRVDFFDSLRWYLDTKQGNYGFPQIYRQIINQIIILNGY